MYPRSIAKRVSGASQSDYLYETLVGPFLWSDRLPQLFIFFGNWASSVAAVAQPVVCVGSVASCRWYRLHSPVSRRTVVVCCRLVLWVFRRVLEGPR